MRYRVLFAVVVILVFSALPTESVDFSAQAPPPRQNLLPPFTIGEWSGGFPSFVANPTCVAIYEDEIYVLDTGNKRVAVFDLSGQFVRAFGRAGEGPGEFGLGRWSMTGPDLAVTDGRVFVSDRPQRKIHVFATDGEVVGSFLVNDGRTAVASMAASRRMSASRKSFNPACRVPNTVP